MISNNFIIEQLKEIILRFPHLSISYGFDKLSETHIVEINPSFFYKNDVTYRSFENSIIDKFVEMFPFESLTFVTEEDGIPIQNPIFTSNGMLYDLQLIANKFNWAEIINEPSLSFDTIDWNKYSKGFENVYEILSTRIFEYDFDYKKIDIDFEEISKSYVNYLLSNPITRKHFICHEMDNVIEVDDDSTKFSLQAA